MADRETPLAEIHAEARVPRDAAGGTLPLPKYDDRRQDHTGFGENEKDYDGHSVEGGAWEPTDEDLTRLRRVPDTLPLSTWLVAVIELCERFTYYGVNACFQNYIQNPADDPLLPGAIGLGQQGATGLSYFFQFFCYLTPIMGAVVADQFLGKYRTICVFAGVYVVGLLILLLTSLPVSISHGAALGGLVTAMIVIGFGTGGIKSNVSPLIAEQYTNTRKFVRTLKNGERVIVDPAITIQRIFMFFYACINIGSLSAIATTVMEQRIGFWSAYLLPFCVFFVGLLVLVLGRKKYVQRPPRGSVIPDAFRAVWVGIRKRNLDAAKPSWRATNGDHTVTRWNDQFIDELRRALVACRVFIFYPIYWVCYGQMLNNFISQAGTMELHGIPNDIMQNIDPLAIIIFIPLLDSLVYPVLRKIGIRFLPITRIFFGFLFAALAMAYAAIVQHIIYSAGPCYSEPVGCLDGTQPNQVHVAVQTPAYVFLALSEIFAVITGLEYAFSKAPASMKSFIMSIFLATNAFGSALGIALSPTATNPKLLWMYTGLAVATAAVGIAFWLCFRHLNKEEDRMNELDALNLDEAPVPIGQSHKIHPHRQQRMLRGSVGDTERQ